MHVLPFHEVVHFDTLMVDFIEQESVFADVTLVAACATAMTWTMR